MMYFVYTSSILTVEPINDTPNLHFDNMGTTRLYHRKWKTIYTYDLRNLRTMEKTIHQAMTGQDLLTDRSYY